MLVRGRCSFCRLRLMWVHSPLTRYTVCPHCGNRVSPSAKKTAAGWRRWVPWTPNKHRTLVTSCMCPN